MRNVRAEREGLRLTKKWEKRWEKGEGEGGGGEKEKGAWMMIDGSTGDRKKGMR